jgi:hypothetical protein
MFSFSWHLQRCHECPNFPGLIKAACGIARAMENTGNRVLDYNLPNSNEINVLPKNSSI